VGKAQNLKGKLTLPPGEYERGARKLHITDATWFVLIVSLFVPHYHKSDRECNACDQMRRALVMKRHKSHFPLAVYEATFGDGSKARLSFGRRRKDGSPDADFGRSMVELLWCRESIGPAPAPYHRAGADLHQPQARHC
jgi:hypothetical protein